MAVARRAAFAVCVCGGLMVGVGAPRAQEGVTESTTISGWVEELGSRRRERIERATQELIAIGAPAIPALLSRLQQEDSGGHRVCEVLAGMGPAASEALPKLTAMATDKGLTPPATGHRGAWVRARAVLALAGMGWAADRVAPVLQAIALDKSDDEWLRATVCRGSGGLGATMLETLSRVAADTEESVDVRKGAVNGLASIGKDAIPRLRDLAGLEARVVRDTARQRLGRLLDEQGIQTEKAYWIEVVEADPFDPSVPDYLPRTKDGSVSNGAYDRSHPLSEKVKALYRERLARDPDAEVAWGLARIIDTQLWNTDTGLAVGRRSSSGKWARECPTESHTTMASALEICFSHSGPNSIRRREAGVALAKVRLQQGDWAGMNAVLRQLGQEPIPAAGRPWLHAPPTDWRNVRAAWQAADPAMRSGDCALVLRIEKDGRGLPGVHVLVKKEPPRTRIVHTGVSVDTLFHRGFHPFSFGYRADRDRAETRYAVSDEAGVVRFERLPEIDVRMEVLVPTGNFPEPGRRWEIVMEGEAGTFVRFPMGHDHCPVLPREESAQVKLRPGQTATYPRLRVVAEELQFSVGDWGAIDPTGLVLRWQPARAAGAGGEIRYELELSVSAPDENTGRLTGPPALMSKTVTTRDTEWPLGAKGVDGVRLCPGNIYLLNVNAIDDKAGIVAVGTRTRIWTPWAGVTDPPLTEARRCPIHHDIWWRGQFPGHEDTDEEVDQPLDRFLRDHPTSFEYDYVRVGKAWQDWHHRGKAAARPELQELVEELPQGNVARDTAAWLLSELESGKKPPKRLRFVSTLGDDGSSTE